MAKEKDSYRDICGLLIEPEDPENVNMIRWRENTVVSVVVCAYQESDLDISKTIQSLGKPDPEWHDYRLSLVFDGKEPFVRKRSTIWEKPENPSDTHTELMSVYKYYMSQGYDLKLASDASSTKVSEEQSPWTEFIKESVLGLEPGEDLFEGKASKGKELSDVDSKDEQSSSSAESPIPVHPAQEGINLLPASKRGNDIDPDVSETRAMAIKEDFLLKAQAYMDRFGRIAARKKLPRITDAEKIVFDKFEEAGVLHESAFFRPVKALGVLLKDREFMKVRDMGAKEIEYDQFNTTIESWRAQIIVKAGNHKKPTSHMLGVDWSQHYCTKTRISIFLDAGSAFSTGRDLRKLVDHLISNQGDTAGACGRMITRPKTTEGPASIYQSMEYTFSQILVKGMQSKLGFLTVLPGACCAYDLSHLSLVEWGEYTKYYSSMSAGLMERNMRLVEDRFICVLLLGKGKKLSFLEDVYFYTDPKEYFYDFLRQRRRWLNGGLFFSLVWLPVSAIRVAFKNSFRFSCLPDNFDKAKMGEISLFSTSFLVMMIEFITNVASLFSLGLSVSILTDSLYTISPALHIDNLIAGWGEWVIQIYLLAIILHASLLDRKLSPCLNKCRDKGCFPNFTILLILFPLSVLWVVSLCRYMSGLSHQGDGRGANYIIHLTSIVFFGLTMVYLMKGICSARLNVSPEAAPFKIILGFLFYTLYYPPMSFFTRYYSLARISNTEWDNKTGYTFSDLFLDISSLIITIVPNLVLHNFYIRNLDEETTFSILVVTQLLNLPLFLIAVGVISLCRSCCTNKG